MAQSNNSYSLTTQLSNAQAATIPVTAFERMLWGNNHPGERSASLLDVYNVYSVMGAAKKITIADKFHTDTGGAIGKDVTDTQKRHVFDEVAVTNVANSEALLTPGIRARTYFLSDYGDEMNATDRGEEIFNEQIPLFSKTVEYEKAAAALRGLFSRNAAGVITGNGSTAETRANTVAATVLGGTDVDTDGAYTLGGDADANVEFNEGHVMATADAATFENFGSFLLMVPIEDWSRVLAKGFFADAESRAGANYGVEANPMFSVRAVRTYNVRPEMGVYPIDKTEKGFNQYDAVSGNGHAGRMFAVKMNATRGGGLVFGKYAGKAVNAIKVEDKSSAIGSVITAVHGLGALAIGYNVVDCFYKTQAKNIR